MAKKKSAKKPPAKKKSTRPAKKSAAKKKHPAKKKRPAKKAAVKKKATKIARAKSPKKAVARAKASKAATPVRKPKSKARPQRSSTPPVLKAHQYVEKMSVTIKGPDETGDIVATESLGGVAQVHHTVHQGAETSAIPGQDYQALKKLGEGTHEIEVVRTLTPPPGTSPLPTTK